MNARRPRRGPALAVAALVVAAALSPRAAAPQPPVPQPSPAQQPPPAQPPLGQPPQGQQPLPSFRAGVDIVSLTVTVTQPDGRYVTGLEAGAFEVYEDGARQDIEFFNRSNLPVARQPRLDVIPGFAELFQTREVYIDVNGYSN
jgi:Ca-activated chloride channel family protein